MKKRKDDQNNCTDSGSSLLKQQQHKKNKACATEQNYVNEENEIEEGESSLSQSTSLSKQPISAFKHLTKKRKSFTSAHEQDTASSDEERWLNAIESGKLEEVDDELKKIKPKDPKLMTARQRAMYEKTSGDPNKSLVTGLNKSKKTPTTTLIDGVHANVSSTGQLLLALPNFKHKEKEKVPLTAEDLEREKEKAQKRKALADEKREKDKKKTMERLLKKQDSKMVKSTKNRPMKFHTPMITYKNTVDIITLNFPINFECPIKPKMPIQQPKQILCGIEGCRNLKRYSCSKTNLPLCSFECYKKKSDI